MLREFPGGGCGSIAMRTVEEHQRIVAELITARPAAVAALADAEGRVLSRSKISRTTQRSFLQIVDELRGDAAPLFHERRSRTPAG